MWSRLPWSLSWFALTGVIYLLQLIPFTGIFLMVLLAPFWSIVTINAGFAALAVEALTGRVSRLWLLAPLAYIGGYYAFAGLTDRAIERIDAEFRAHNALQRVAFDAAQNDLVVEANANDLGGAANTLLRNYDLPLVFDHHPSNAKRRANELPSLDSAYRAHRIGPVSACAKISAEARAASLGIHGHHERGKNGAAPSLCGYTTPEAPSRPTVRVSAKAHQAKSFPLAYKETVITIAPPTGPAVTLRTGQAAPLAMLPMPAMGCALNSGAPSWDCFAGFMRGKERGLGGDGAWGGAAIEATARALALRASPLDDRRQQLAGADTAALDAVIARQHDRALANLDHIIADPSLRATVHDFAGLTERTGDLVTRADAMLTAMEAALVRGSGESETARNLQRLIAALPAAAFARLAPAMLGALERHRPQPDKRGKVRDERIDDTLLLRLADGGASALPLAERLARSAKLFETSPVLALCRIGASAAATADFIAQRAAGAEPHRREARKVAYLTLRRMGRADLAETVVGDANRDRDARAYDVWRRTITPDSPPSVCSCDEKANGATNACH